MLPRVHIVIYLYAVIHLFSRFVGSECPSDASNMIQLCIKSSLPNFGLGPPSRASPPAAIKTSIQMSKDSCQSNKLEESARCMQDILDKCQGTTDGEQLLQRLFDKQKTMQTVRYFCASLPTYETYAKCISEQHLKTLNCSKTAALRYKKIMDAHATDDVLLLESCRFHGTATSCLEDLVFANCGIEAAEFIETITIGQRPPACDEKQRKYSKGYLNNESNKTIASYGVLFLLLIMKSFVS